MSHSLFEALDLEVDHLHPASWNGADAAEDYVTACYGCNRAKRDRPAVPITKEQAIDALEFVHSIPRTRQPVGKARAFVPACGTTFGLDVEDGRAAVCSLVNSLQRVAEVQAIFPFVRVTHLSDAGLSNDAEYRNRLTRTAKIGKAPSYCRQVA